MRKRFPRYLDEETVATSPDAARKFPLSKAPVDIKKIDRMNLRKLNDKFLNRNPKFVNSYVPPKHTSSTQDDSRLKNETSQDRFAIKQLALGKKQDISTLLTTNSCFSPTSVSSTQRSFFNTRSIEGGHTSPLTAATPRHAAQTNSYFGKNSVRGVTVDKVRKQFSTLTGKLGSTMLRDEKSKDSKRSSRRHKNS